MERTSKADAHEQSKTPDTGDTTTFEFLGERYTAFRSLLHNEFVKKDADGESCLNEKKRLLADLGLEKFASILYSRSKGHVRFRWNTDLKLNADYIVENQNGKVNILGVQIRIRNKYAPASDTL